MNKIWSRFRRGLSYYRRSFGYIRPNRNLIIIALPVAIIYSVISAVAVYSFLPVFNIVFQENGAATVETVEEENVPQGIDYWRNWSLVAGKIAASSLRKVAGEGDTMAQLTRLILFIASLSALASLLMLMVNWLFIIVQADGVRNLSEDLYSRLGSMPMSFFDDVKAGVVISRLGNDIGGTVAMVTSSILSLLLNIFLAIALFVILLVINLKLVLFIVPVLLLTGLMVFIIGRLVQLMRTKFLLLQANFTATLLELLHGIRVIKAFAAEDIEKRKWRSFVDRARGLEVASNVTKVLPVSLSEIVAVIVAGAVLFFGGRMIVEGSLVVSELMLFFVVLVRFQKPAQELVMVWIKIQDGMAYAVRAFDLLDSPVEKVKKGRSVYGLEKAIVFEDVSFGYGADMVVRGVNMELPFGRVVALVGPSGSGKSSLVSLLLRFYDVATGTITLDGQDIREFDRRSYRSLFGVVGQETFLFHDTVRSNIVYGLDRQVSEEEMRRAAIVAQAHDFIDRLPAGYDTVVGDRGVRLSGGQRQRIAIARAIIRSPQVLVLDEATSSLDTQSERMVQKALDDLITSRTSLVVAHRLSTVVAADVIYVMHEGKIVQRGRHQQLISEDGLYRHLWELQSQSRVY